jgi:hypothetical protein
MIFAAAASSSAKSCSGRDRLTLGHNGIRHARRLRARRAPIALDPGLELARIERLF